MPTMTSAFASQFTASTNPHSEGHVGRSASKHNRDAKTFVRYDREVDQQLFDAIQRCYFDRADALVRHHGADVNAKNNHGFTMLHFFAQKNRKSPQNLSKLRIMLQEYGADVNARDQEGKTVLFTAIRCGDRALFQFLLERPELNLFAQDEKGMSPLQYAKRLQGRGDMARILEHIIQRSRGGEQREATNSRLLSEERSFNPSVDEFKPDTSATKKHEIRDELGNTPMHWAALSGDIQKVLQAKAESGMDIDTPNDFGNTALHWASTLNNPDFFRQMVTQAGANPKLKNNQGLSPVDEKPKSGVDFWPILPWKK